MLVAYGAMSVAYLQGMNFPYFLHAAKMFPFFYAGSLMGLSHGVWRWLTEGRWTYTLSVAAYFGLSLFGIHVSMINLTGIFAIVVLLQLFSHYNAHIPRLLGRVGEYSLEIYVLHWFLLPSLPWVAPWLTQHAPSILLDNVNAIPLLLISLPLSAAIIAACMAIGRVIHHNPITSWLALGGQAK